jgi:hypothetical protein
MSWSTERPYPVFRSSVGQYTLAYDEMSKPEVERILDELDPWLRRHWERLVHEDDDAETQAALGAKINAVMGALAERSDEAKIDVGRDPEDGQNALSATGDPEA